jgi:hypothetical protein
VKGAGHRQRHPSSGALGALVVDGKERTNLLRTGLGNSSGLGNKGCPASFEPPPELHGVLVGDKGVGLPKSSDDLGHRNAGSPGDLSWGVELGHDGGS